MVKRPMLILPMVLVLLGTASQSLAQTEGRVSIGAGIASYHVTSDHVGSATIPTFGVAATIEVMPWFDVEAHVLGSSGTLRRERTGTSISFAPPGSSREEIERQAVLTRFVDERRIRAVLSVGTAFHPRRDRYRLLPSLFVGVTSHLVQDRSLRDPLQLPPGVTLEQVLRIVPRDEEHSRALGSITVGGGLAVALSRQLTLAPELRYDYGSIGDEINNAARASLLVLWRFR